MAELEEAELATNVCDEEGKTDNGMIDDQVSKESETVNVEGNNKTISIISDVSENAAELHLDKQQNSSGQQVEVQEDSPATSLQCGKTQPTSLDSQCVSKAEKSLVKCLESSSNTCVGLASDLPEGVSIENVTSLSSVDNVEVTESVEESGCGETQPSSQHSNCVGKAVLSSETSPSNTSVDLASDLHESVSTETSRSLSSVDNVQVAENVEGSPCGETQPPSQHSNCVGKAVVSSETSPSNTSVDLASDFHESVSTENVTSLSSVDNVELTENVEGSPCGETQPPSQHSNCVGKALVSSETSPSNTSVDLASDFHGSVSTENVTSLSSIDNVELTENVEGSPCGETQPPSQHSNCVGKAVVSSETSPSNTSVDLASDFHESVSNETGRSLSNVDNVQVAENVERSPCEETQQPSQHSNNVGTDDALSETSPSNTSVDSASDFHESVSTETCRSRSSVDNVQVAENVEGSPCGETQPPSQHSNSVGTDDASSKMTPSNIGVILSRDSSKGVGTEYKSSESIARDVSINENMKESNQETADASLALSQTKSAIDVDIKTKPETNARFETLESASYSLPVPIHSETHLSNVTAAELTSLSDRIPKGSCASRNNHCTEFDQNDVVPSLDITRYGSDGVTADLQILDRPSTELSPDGSSAINMHSSNSSQERILAASRSSLESTSSIETNSSQNVIPVETNLPQRTSPELDDDILLSELDDLLHKSSLGDDLIGEKIIHSELPNGLRREKIGSIDTQKLLVEMETLRRRCSQQELEVRRIQHDNTNREGHIRKLLQTSQESVVEINREKTAVQRVHLLRIKELEAVVEQYKQDVSAGRERQASHDKAAKKAIYQLQQEMILRVDQVKKLYEDSVRDKENIVIKYAKSEKEVMEQKKAREATEKKLREVSNTMEALNAQIKQLRKELAKLKNASCEKESDFALGQKEIEQLKEELSSQAIKVKWAQNKLKSELDAHKETKVKQGKTEQKLAEAREETEQIRRNCQEMIKTYQESEEIKSNSLDQQLKVKETEFQQHLQEQSDYMELHHTRLRELETLKKKYHDNMAELDSLQVKTKCLEDERLQNEALLSKFKELLNSQKDENKRLNKQVDELKALQHKLQDAKEEVKKMETNISGQKTEFSELESELESSRQKECELLQFTEKITTNSTRLHSQNLELSDKVTVLSTELKKLQEEMEELRTEHGQVTLELKQEKQYRERESAILASKLTEKAKAVELLSIQLDDARDEMKTLRRKNLANIKDLTRQLQQAQKRLDMTDSKDGSPKDNISLGSRTSSNGSLDTMPNVNSSSSSHGVGSIVANHSTQVNSAMNNTRYEEQHQPQIADHTVAIASNDYPGIDKNMLVERIVRLQRAQARKNEKIEFMQEHVNSLVEEIKKKSKIIQQYIMREEAGALIAPASDVNKAQMSKQTGIMSSLYSSKATDKTMTLDLSLEINRKLQSVLEDTLLKNITLKENIETLGGEIAYLTRKLNSPVQPKDQRPKRK